MRVALQMPLAKVPVVPLEARRGIRVGVDHDGLAMDARCVLLRGFGVTGGLAATDEPEEREEHEEEETP